MTLTRPTNSQVKRRNIIARLLADHFLSLEPRENPYSMGCACLGVSCMDLRCRHFWASLLASYDRHDFRRMIGAYLMATGRD